MAHADSERVHLLAPLEPNLNHRQTGFGGSISCSTPAAADWDRFDRAFSERRRARIDLQVDVCVAGMVAARFAGRYVVLH